MTDFEKDPITNPAKAIRHYCINVCMAGEAHEVRKCEDTGCSLFTFRMGKNPHRNRPKMSEEQKESLRKAGLKGSKLMMEKRDAQS